MVRSLPLSYWSSLSSHMLGPKISVVLLQISYILHALNNFHTLFGYAGYWFLSINLALTNIVNFSMLDTFPQS